MSLAAVAHLWGHDGNRMVQPPPVVEDVADFPAPIYSRKQVVKAGKALTQPMPWVGDHDERAEWYRQVFKIAYDWRSSHAYPMRVLRDELKGLIQRTKKRGVTAARLKRMSSVRKKLNRLNTTLAQIQDIGGCRGIVGSPETLNALLDYYRGSNCHRLREDRSYLDNPRPSGYRSHHLVFDFQPASNDEEPFRDRRIEIQLRTRLQHSWATAVEAIGLHRNEDLKAEQGDSDWLRFFLLVSAGLAEFEGTAPVPYAPAKAERISELKALNEKLGAVRRLETLNEGFRYLDKNRRSGAAYYMLQFNNGILDISSYEKIMRASQQYGEEERRNSNTVVVVVDTLDALKEAFPNYFLDVRMFTQNVVHMLRAEPLITKLSVRQQSQTAEGHEVNWLRKYFPKMYGDES